MLRILLLSFTLIVFTISSIAQTVRGKVSTSDGQPVAYATVYIKENTIGIVANENGEFQVTLAAGSYNIEARSIGFESQTKTINVENSPISISFILSEKEQTLKEVTIHASTEDPAYNVMRHAIARAPYHLYQVQSYQSDNYMKGSAKIDHIPALMKMMITDQKLRSLIGKLLVLESQNKVTYRAPASYTQQVIAYKSSIPKEMEPKGGIRMSTSSIYTSKFDDVISPLSPQAFRYYRFTLSDIFNSGKYQINKIHISPKTAGAKLFSGDIYIIENDWSVFSLDLSVKEYGTTSHYKVNYQEVAPSVFMPITYNMYANINTMGVTGYARYYSSVKYNDLKLKEQTKIAESTKVSPEVTTTIQNKKQQRIQAEIEKITTKEKLSTRDALKLARLSNALMEPDELSKNRKNLEIKDTSLVKMQIDSMASRRDSVYWQNIRNVPLLKEEALSFKRNDSLPAAKAVSVSDNNITISTGTHASNSFLSGKTIALSKKMNFSYSGLIRGLLKEYNFVDGAWVGQQLSVDYKASEKNFLRITPAVYYAWARKAVNWSSNFEWNYLPLKQGHLNIIIQDYSTDIQQQTGTSRFLNSLSSLISADNVIRFYRNKAISITNTIDLANGLKLTTSASVERRSLLRNHTSYNFLHLTPTPNIPDETYTALLPTHQANTTTATLSFTPYNHYRLNGQNKQDAGSSYPTFSFSWKGAFKAGNYTTQSDYQLIKLSVEQKIKTGEWSNIRYKSTIGNYINSRQLYAPDFHYFATNPLAVTFNNTDNSFMLLPNYTCSSTRWAEFHINYYSSFLFLKRLHFLQNMPINEAIHFKTLIEDRSAPVYNEIGYSIGLGKAIRAGIFGSFASTDFKRIGFKLSMSLSSK